MEKFENTVNAFLQVLQEYKGAKPVFSIDYAKEEILIVDASAGFVKALVNRSRATVSMHNGTLAFKMFADMGQAIAENYDKH